MALFRVEFIRQNKKTFFGYAILACIIIGAVFFAGDALKYFFISPERVREWVTSYGALAPLALFLLQVLQVVIAPLNNFVINFLGGYIFGPWIGFVLNYTGWIVGATIVFWLARLIGVPFVKFFITKNTIETFDRVMEHGTYVIFMLLVLPGPPDDFLVYVMGLSRTIRFRTFLWMVLVAKIPGKLATSILGSGAAEHSMWSVALYGIFVIAAIVLYVRHPSLWRVWRTPLRHQKEEIKKKSKEI